MHKFLLVLAIAAFSTSPAFADGGLNLSWDDCGSAGVAAKTFACDTNTGSNLLVASAQIPAAVDSACGFLLTIDVHFPNGIQPDWWKIDSPFSDEQGEQPCRDSLALVTEDVPSSGMCESFFPPFGPRGSLYELRRLLGYGGDRSQIRIEGYVPYESVRQTPSHSTEYYLVGIRINHSKTVGLDACPGCVDAACMVLNEVKFIRGNCAGGPFSSSEVFVNAPLARNFITWQSEALPNCVASTFAKRSTWGRLRSLYR